MEYQTRKMVAAKEFRHAGEDLVPGKIFHATMSDARYLAKHQKASYALDEPFAQPAPAAPVKAPQAPAAAAKPAPAPAPASTPAPAPAPAVTSRPILKLDDAKKQDDKKADEPVITPRPVTTDKPADTPAAEDSITRRPLST